MFDVLVRDDHCSLSVYALSFSIEPHKYQLWAYIYQARDLLAMDESGMNGMTIVKPVSNAVVSRSCTQRPATPIATQNKYFGKRLDIYVLCCFFAFCRRENIHILSTALRKNESKQLKEGQTTNY